MKTRVLLTVFHAPSAADGEVGGNSQAGPFEGGHLGKQFFRIAGAAGYTCLLLVTLALTSAPPAGAQPVCVPQFSDWSAPINLCDVNSPAGTPCDVNSAGADQGPAISKDELELYFVRELNDEVDPDPDPGDLWVSTRKHKKDPWGSPQNLGAKINTRPTLFTNDDPPMPINGRENLPTLSHDGLRLYFSSNRPRPLPGGGVTTDFDMWVSERTDSRNPLGWARPVNLGIGFNTNGGQELGPVPFEDPLTETFTLYFYAIRPGTGARDLFTSTLDENGVFTPHPIAELNTPCNDEQPSIRRDGLELFFTSNRSVGSPMTCLSTSDIWVSTRSSTSDPWSGPVNLGLPINTAGNEARPALSFDGRNLYFFSDRPGGSGATDLWVSTRTKLDDCDDGDDDD
jgi:WD40 repeat protein